MSGQNRTLDAEDPRRTTESSYEVIEKSLTGSSHSEVTAMDTNPQTVDEFLNADDD